ncbi:ATP-binding cassette domain-containing protein [Starkeya sp. 3C]|uniref:ATP-binding cassette domain-containing protein n=1 Tax=Ancylobacter moscoviensis TaxID=2597768 RepID=A0ABY3DQ32_9HYPH|nr:ATP-binding cassette domain-containing protein [Ancylobacter moscoviensis]TSJ61718.1 ATP-binding cassette domain-containing protein [Ancylobacter moscoviensis]
MPSVDRESGAAGAIQPIIVADRICKDFGSLTVLRGVSLEAANHDVISIIGASGSGKSTFLRCLNLLEMPTSGEISIQGEKLDLRPGPEGLVSHDKAQVRRIRSSLGMVFQGFNLWSHMTVLENVMAAPVHVQGKSKAEAREKAEHYLQRVGLYEKRDAYPAFMSGGQQQRAAIARALAMEPAAVLFDEPTSALDPELVGEVLKVIRGLAEEGRTMIVVTHEMAFARDVSSKVLFLHKGEVEEAGPPQEVLRQPRSERLRAFLTRAAV